jgi:KDO2-lipid IV(A) lauroyltransferase
MASTLCNLEYLLVRMLLAVLQGMPYAAALRFGSLPGVLAYWLASVPRRRTESNLQLACGGALDAMRTEAITRGAFDTMGRPAAEVAPLARRGHRGFTLENPEILERAHRLGRGIILVSAHMGCFARLMLVPKLMGIPASPIMKKQRNRRLLQWNMELMKDHFDLDVLLKTTAVDHIPGELQLGRLVGFFADQHPRAGGFPAPYFGRPILVTAGPAVYAKRYGSPIVVLTPVSRSDGTHVARCEGPVSPEGTLEEISRRWLALVEARIHDHTEQWMWMHRRWREQEVA